MLGTGPDDYVVSSQSLLADLPDVVRRGLQRAQNRDTVAQKLRDAERALELLRKERAADATAAAEKLGGAKRNWGRRWMNPSQFEAPSSSG